MNRWLLIEEYSPIDIELHDVVSSTMLMSTDNVQIAKSMIDRLSNDDKGLMLKVYSEEDGNTYVYTDVKEMKEWASYF